MQSSAIVLSCIFAAVCYGIAHDQITARVCVEYFTVGHPPIFPTDDPTLLGLGWGIIATWWVGLFLGLGLALAARGGSRPPRSVGSLIRPVVGLLAVTAIAALTMGILGYALAQLGLVELLDPLDSEVPQEKHAAFLADLWAHTASYFVGGIGGIVVMIRVWRSRRGPTAIT
jgi:hypothetical protein